MTKSFLKWYEKNEYSFWLVILTTINLLQASFTELFDDEAYYWMYSQYLNWGYFDHPPMIALLIKIGYFFFKNELGVRLLSVLMTSFSLWILRFLITPGNDKRLLAIIFSLGIIHYGGIFAAPDLPLVFFEVCLLFLYKKFLIQPTWFLSFSMGIVMAALLYSKYHSALLLGFMMLGNIRLFTSKKWWLSVIIATILYLPHILWQIQYKFPSIEYQLIDRSSAYKYIYTTDYILGWLFIMGPLIGIFFIISSYKTKAHHSTWLNTIQWVFVGTAFFFLFSTFRGRVEANWVIIGLMPGIIILHNYFNVNHRLEKILYRILPLSIVIIIGVRSVLIFNLLGNKIQKNVEVHSNAIWANKIKQLANGKNVMFINSYQLSSKFSFYTKELSTSYNTNRRRKNQFDIWAFDKKFVTDSVLVVSCDSFPHCDSINSIRGILYYKMLANPNLKKSDWFNQYFPK